MADLNDDEGEGGEGGGEGWLATFCDVALLLLTFFVLLLSMSSIESRRFNEAFSSVREKFGGDTQANIKFEQLPEDEKSLDMVLTHNQAIQEQRKTFNTITSFITENAMDDKINAVLEEGTITLQVPSDVLFDPASESIKPEGIVFMRTLRDLFLKNREQDINIRGYTDNTPIPHEARFNDNWELSALRAVNVLKELYHGGIEAVRLTATGYGDLNPIAPNTTEKERAKNRRVEFVLERRVGGAK